MADEPSADVPANVVALARESLLVHLVQPYLAGKLSAEAATRFEEALLESRELQDAVALHRAMREGLEAMGRVPQAPATPSPLARWRRWILGA